MLPISLHDKAAIESYLRQDARLHIYELGDLDDFFWPYTNWLASQEGEQISALMLLYSGMDVPVLLAIGGEAGLGALSELFAASLRLLPRRFYAHLQVGLAQTLAAGYRLEPHGRYLIMGLEYPERLADVDARDVQALGMADEAELQDFYSAAHPDNWFDPRMLATGHYYGIRCDGRLASVAGIHVYSPQYSAAALGNIVTHPAYRSQGMGLRVTARLCQELRKTVSTIGLNVRADNAPALRIYTRLGFEPVAEYEEYMVEAG